MRVLVVEDEVRLADNLAAALREGPGFAVDCVEDGLQRLHGQFTERTMRCFRPAAPRPERRVLREQIASVT